ncbi:MAG TPA: wax ester/triacylglycerol synthase family O-acyltransferase [Pseudonocardiaceae bacterium]|nr:wax ester/triacylglycerol synthase family O-acyltransferase [Pseudonocardiaceae bacterium]
MADRLTALDASLLYMEDTTTPMHIGGVAVFRRPRSGFDYDKLISLIEQRLPLVPRYRQRVLHVPGHLARPVWADDERFDITHHVRLSALPKPGTQDQLDQLVARLMARPLDHHRPLWELYLVEGLQRNRFALVTKTHYAMVDGVGSIEIGQVIMDTTAGRPTADEQVWMPEPHPGPAKLVADAVSEMIARPGEVVDNVRAAAGDVVSTARKVLGTVSGVASVLGAVTRTERSSPLNVRITADRRFAVARTTLDDLKKVRAAHGGTVNDVILTVVSGALRAWLMSRGEPVTSHSMVRAMAPLSVRESPVAESEARSEQAPGGAVTEVAGAGSVDRGNVVTTGLGTATDVEAADLVGARHAAQAGMGGAQVSAYLVDLPVGEPNPVVRLQHISHAVRGNAVTGQLVAADALVRLGGFAPPTLHALGARAASAFSRRIFNLVITNVPGPQVPLYASGAKLLEMFPVVPLAHNQALSIGVTSYDGGVYFGLNADRSAMPDVDNLARMVEEAVEELLGTVSG